MDFAGDTVVHSVGGWAALAGAVILGPRIGKYGKDGKAKAIPGHNMSLAVIGLFVLWLGWFGFNPGSTMSFQNPADVVHILVTTNTAAIAAVVTSTLTAWIFIGKPDLGMTINGCLAGLVGITGSCAYVSIGASLIIGAIAGIIVVFAVMFFDKIKVDDPVGATAVHLCCGVFGTLCVGLFAKEGVTSLSSKNGLFYGGDLEFLGVQCLGIIAVGAFVFIASLLVWFIIKKTIGIRVSYEEEIAGLDIGEHGNIAYPDFAAATIVTELTNNRENAKLDVTNKTVKDDTVSSEAAIPVIHKEHSDTKITKVTIITNQDKFSQLQAALDKLGITGLTVTNVLGYGMQKGQLTYFLGAPIDTRLLPKIKIDVVVCKISIETLVNTVKSVLYTGNIGDGKIFIYDVEDVIKIRTNEHGYDALQDEE